MDSSSGVSISISISSNSSGLQMNSGSEEDLQLIMDQRKKKRMISNRESARRSRLRKQKHLDGLMTQVARLRQENQQIAATWSRTSQQHANVESENAILRAQVAELTQRLQSLNEIISYLGAAGNDRGSGSSRGCAGFEVEDEAPAAASYDFAWNYFSQPSMAAAAAEAGFMY